MIEKLNITSYKDYSYGDSISSFEVLLNPKNFATKQEINYTTLKPMGAPAEEPTFKNESAEQCEILLIFDSTGVIANPPTGLKGKTVAQQIEVFMNVVSKFDGNTHKPNPLELTWGDFGFKGVLLNLNVTYTLFKPNGLPARAEAVAKFKTASDAQEAIIAVKNSSPDMTHIKLIKAGDSLSGMCLDIYGGENYFVQVAQANGFNHLRGDKAGVKAIFPPLT